MISTFEADDLFSGWEIMDDGVMGGLSKGEIDMSLENNGGFSKLQSETNEVDLSDFEGITIRVKGDGRTYKLALQCEGQTVQWWFWRNPISFESDFDTVTDEWIEVNVPYSAFIGTHMGRLVQGAFDPSKVEEFGIFIADKVTGAFDLTIDWIK